MNSKLFHHISRMLNLVFILAMLFTQCQSYQKDTNAASIKSSNEVPTIQDMIQYAYDKDLPFLANMLKQVQNYENNKDIDINKSDANSHNETTLHQTIWHFDGAGSLSTAQDLISKGANVNKKADNNVTPLHLAVYKGNEDMVKLLLANNAEVDVATTDLARMPIHIAAKQSNPAITNLLIASKVNINSEGYRGATALHIAANFGNLETVKTLHQNGADVNRQDQDELTPLHLAAQKGHTKVIEYLMQNGANSRTKASTLTASPLHLAIYEGHVAAVEELLKGDKDPKTYIELEAGLKCRPLHIAAYQGHADIIKLLAKKGAEIDAQDQDGFTALHWAASKGHPKAIQALLEQGANKKIRDNRKHTPLQIAKFAPDVLKVTDKVKRQEYKDIVQLLKAQK